ncbi:MAG: S8 family serine peptidase [Acidobacteria bacterium]|nr:S8 family serine peptidase [Acidobacteriota bacterium]
MNRHANGTRFAFAILALLGALGAGCFTPAAAQNGPGVPDPARVRVMGYDFDPVVEGEPVLPPTLRFEGSGPTLRLVQFTGLLRGEWLDKLVARGLVPLQYYPNNTYLVWGSEAQARSAAGLDFVRWQGAFHPAYKTSPGLAGFRGTIENVAVTFFNDGDETGVPARIAAAGGKVLQVFPAQPDRRFLTAVCALDAAALETVARLEAVWALEYASPRPGLEDEMCTQVLAGNITGSPGTPVTGYFTWLAAKGLDGTGITWADVDTGLDGAHPDIAGRTPTYVAYAGAATPNADSDGHGTHTAGAIFGDPRTANGGTGIQDGDGFYWGVGMAPRAGMVIQNALLGTNWPPTGGWQVLSKDSVLNGAMGSSNSWFTGASGAQGYSAACRTHDLMVRDANFDTATVAEPLVMVFSAGNSGPGASTLTEPKEAKNLISVGASQNYRVGAIWNMASFSSRGPALDGRTLPTVTAPGEQTVSWKSSTSGTSSCTSAVSGSGSAYYSYCSGTSMACPLVSGSSALLAQWWADEGRGVPSPAMVKALLINGATDMAGGSGVNGNIPSNSQGWGRVDLANVIGNGVQNMYHDQNYVFTAAGQSKGYTFYIDDPAKPVRISLVWSDAAGAAGANPALVNDLDLTVVNGSNTYLGNVFSGGLSATGGSADRLNNIENVYLAPPWTSTAFQVTVNAYNVPGDGVPYNGSTTDQDFALVIYNASEVPAPAVTLETSAITAEGCSPANSLPDPGEAMTWDITLRNVGSLDTTDVVATLQATGGVTSPGASQAYGALTAGGAGITRSFTFTVDPALVCGESITLTFQLQDGATDLGTLTLVRSTGIVAGGTSVLLSETFEPGANPPAGWLTTPVGTVSGTTTPEWAAIGAGTNPVNTPHAGSYQGKFNSYNTSSGNAARLYRTSGIDTTAYGQAMFYVKFYMYHDPGYTSNNDNVRVQVSSDGGATWVSCGSPVSRYGATAGWSPHTVDVSAAARNHADVRIAFLGTSAYGNNCFIDDVSFEVALVGCCGQAGTPILQADGAALVSEGCAPGNGVLDPGETVTVAFGLKNVGTDSTADLVADLQLSGGVQCATPPQSYGAVAAGGATVTRSFQFIVSSAAACGGTVTATLHCVDGATDLGYKTYTFTLGSTLTATAAFANTGSISIPTTVSPATPYPSEIAVTGLSGTVQKVKATLAGLSHTYPGDLRILLVGPAGQSCVLLASTGGGTDAVNATLVFDQSAAAPVPSPVVSGTWRPTGSIGTALPSPAPGLPYGTTLDAFNGTDPNGTWKLFVYDAASSDGGSIANGWSLDLVTGTRTCCVTPCATAEHPAAIVDINGDLTSDILWYSTADGNLAAWFLSGAGVVGDAFIGNLADPNWQVTGIGDFNADSFFDVFLRHATTGDMSVWLLSSAGYAGSITTLGSAPVDWKVVGVGDVDGDCRADVFWRNDAAGPLTGMMSLWFVDDCGYRGNSYVGGIGDLDWKVEGIADFDGDRTRDVLWRHAVSGVMSIWFINTAGNFASDMTPGSLDPVWQLAGLGDLNADLKADLFLVNTATGDLIAWLFNGAAVTGSPYLATLPSPDWQVAGIADLDGNGKSDVLLRNTATGEVTLWFTTEAGVTGTLSLGSVDLSWQTRNHAVFAGGI